ncbi:hypothetical protein PLIIFM63780_002147 [Purpureocillium lilacinum]|nr:hypothetical protein PLIIFM63780_002147 [Purpureocillium lilacinum]
MDKPVRLGEIALGTTKRRLASGDLRLENLKDAKARSIAVYKAMEPELAFLPLDCSRSRWNAEDVKDLQEPVVRQLLNSDYTAGKGPYYPSALVNALLALATNGVV